MEAASAESVTYQTLKACLRTHVQIQSNTKYEIHLLLFFSNFSGMFHAQKSCSINRRCRLQLLARSRLLLILLSLSSVISPKNKPVGTDTGLPTEGTKGNQVMAQRVNGSIHRFKFAKSRKKKPQDTSLFSTILKL